jgi:hypothetical protein
MNIIKLKLRSRRQQSPLCLHIAENLHVTKSNSKPITIGPKATYNSRATAMSQPTETNFKKIAYLSNSHISVTSYNRPCHHISPTFLQVVSRLTESRTLTWA